MRAVALALAALAAAPASALAVSDGDLKNLGSGTPSQVHVAEGGAGEIGRVLIGLAIVVVVIVVLYAALRRAHRGSTPKLRGSSAITVLDTVGIGSQRSLHLVRVGDRVVLIGATDHAITALQDLTPDEAADAGLADTAATADEIALALAQPPPQASSGGLLNTIRDRTTRGI